MKPRAVLFDLDDTLHNKSATLKVVADAQFVEVDLQRYGVDRAAWQAAFIELNNLRIEKTEVFERLAKHFILPADLAATLLEDFDRNLGSMALPYEGVLELLSMCKQHGLKTGIVTNGRDQFQRRKIEGLGISQFVDSVVTSGGFGVKKPHHTIFLECLRQLSVPPEQAVFVGDNFEADMEPANALSMLTIWKSAASSDAVAFNSDSLSEIQNFLFASSFAENRR